MDVSKGRHCMKKVTAFLMILILYAGLAFAVEKARDSRFIAYDNGTVLDTQTNLMWALKDNGRDISQGNAQSYCKNYRGGGYSDWRMPMPDELAGLYDQNKTYETDCLIKVHLTELIHLSCAFVCAFYTNKGQYFLDFNNGGWRKDYQRTLGCRVLPVRSSK